MASMQKGARQGRSRFDGMAPQIHPLAGQPAPASMLIDVAKLVSAYHTDAPDPTIAAQRVAFGTSGHRGSAFDRSFNA